MLKARWILPGMGRLKLFYNAISDFAFSFEHFEHVMAKQLFKITRIGQWSYHKGVVVVKAAVGGQHM